MSDNAELISLLQQAQTKAESLDIRDGRLTVLIGIGSALRRLQVSRPKPPEIIESKVIPRSNWPVGMGLILRAAIKEDLGFGDTVYRLLHDSVIQKLANLIPNCGCAERRAKWNEQYPYYIDGKWQVN